MSNGKESGSLRCSFCGKGQKEVKKDGKNDFIAKLDHTAKQQKKITKNDAMRRLPRLLWFDLTSMASDSAQRWRGISMSTGQATHSF